MRCPSLTGQWGFGVETSKGKDTPSGHWEIAGGPVDFAWGYFPQTIPAFPPELTQALIEQAHLPGILANKHAGGVEVIEDYGEEHLKTGKPICYTSADSVLQIAAHEEAFGLERLYDTCKIAREIFDPMKIGRVIARPFVGAARGDFKRTSRRKDFAIPPPPGNILQRADEAGREIISIGKIGDIFAHRHTGRELKAGSNAEHVAIALQALKDASPGALIFANLVDFDTEHGHRRDVPGYAACLEAFDAAVPAIRAAMRPGDYGIITADHGNDPTWRGFDHTREHVPILGFGPGVAAKALGGRKTFADIGATVADWLALPPPAAGASWSV